MTINAHHSQAIQELGTNTPKDSIVYITNPIQGLAEEIELLHKCTSIIETGYDQLRFGSKFELSGTPTRWIPIEQALETTTAIRFKGADVAESSSFSANGTNRFKFIYEAISIAT